MLTYTYLVSEMLDLLFSGHSDAKAIGMEAGHSIGGCLEVFSWGYSRGPEEWPEFQGLEA